MELSSITPVVVVCHVWIFDISLNKIHICPITHLVVFWSGSYINHKERIIILDFGIRCYLFVTILTQIEITNLSVSLLFAVMF